MTKIEDFEHLVLDALDVVKFKLVRSEDDLNSEKFVFSPAMAHQIFGDSENIFGYPDLKVNLMYTAGSLQMHLEVEYDGKVDDMGDGTVKADNIPAILAEKIPDDCRFLNMDEFLKCLRKEDNFKPFGEKLAEHIYREDDGEERLFEIYHCNYEVPSFLKFFVRLECFLLWFVDAASYIDIDDMQWNYFVCYEKYKKDNSYHYATVGYTTVYEYYAYPEHKRPRISQMLLLPPFQKLGIGTKLFETIYNFYRQRPNIVDITVEDPSEDFQRLRIFIDVRLCQNLDVFSKEKIKKGFNKEMIEAARKSHKINPIECRKVYEILRLLYTNEEDEEDYKNYRLDIKKRLYTTFFNEIRKMKTVAKHYQYHTAVLLPPMQERIELLQGEFDRTVKEYKLVINKLRS